MAAETLIIKLGAMGDVLRTTPLLHVLSGEVFWVTKKECIPLLPENNDLLKKVISIDKAERIISDESFETVLSLDDEYEAARLATFAKKTILVGSYLDGNGRLSYTESSAVWFDMGLISRYGKKTADTLKMKNTRTWQEILLGMIGREFRGEEYLINYAPAKEKIAKGKIRIGIEERAGERWPTKQWDKYRELAELLTVDGFEVIFLTQRETIQEYIKDISGCDLLITGDTLALHIALALKIKVVAIFTCTSPTEIYDYGRMIKVVSPLLDKAFYRKEYVHEAVDTITLDEVYQAAITLIG
jgi:heptosyltransferase-2